MVEVSPHDRQVTGCAGNAGAASVSNRLSGFQKFGETRPEHHGQTMRQWFQDIVDAGPKPTAHVGHLPVAVQPGQHADVVDEQDPLAAVLFFASQNTIVA